MSTGKNSRVTATIGENPVSTTRRFATCLLAVVIFDLGDVRKGYLDEFAIGALNFDAGGGQRLGRFHAPHDTADTPAIDRDDLDIVFTVERLQCC